MSVEQFVHRPFLAPDTGADDGFFPKPNDGFPQQPKGSERKPSSELIKSNPFQYLWNVGDALGNFTAADRKFSFHRTRDGEHKPIGLTLYIDDTEHSARLAAIGISSEGGIDIHESDSSFNYSELGMRGYFSPEAQKGTTSEAIQLAATVQRYLAKVNWQERWKMPEDILDESFHVFVKALDRPDQDKILDDLTESEWQRAIKMRGENIGKGRLYEHQNDFSYRVTATALNVAAFDHEKFASESQDPFIQRLMLTGATTMREGAKKLLEADEIIRGRQDPQQMAEERLKQLVEPEGDSSAEVVSQKESPLNAHFQEIFAVGEVSESDRELAEYRAGEINKSARKESLGINPADELLEAVQAQEIVPVYTVALPRDVIADIAEDFRASKLTMQALMRVVGRPNKKGLGHPEHPRTILGDKFIQATKRIDTSESSDDSPIVMELTEADVSLLNNMLQPQTEGFDQPVNRNLFPDATDEDVQA